MRARSNEVLPVRARQCSIAVAESLDVFTGCTSCCIHRVLETKVNKKQKQNKQQSSRGWGLLYLYNFLLSCAACCGWRCTQTLPGLGAPVPVCGPIGLEGILSTGGGECPGRRDGPDGQGQTGSARRTGPDGHALQASFAGERTMPRPGTFFRSRPPPSDTFLFPPRLTSFRNSVSCFRNIPKMARKFFEFSVLCAQRSAVEIFHS